MHLFLQCQDANANVEMWHVTSTKHFAWRKASERNTHYPFTVDIARLRSWYICGVWIQRKPNEQRCKSHYKHVKHLMHCILRSINPTQPNTTQMQRNTNTMQHHTKARRSYTTRVRT